MGLGRYIWGRVRHKLPTIGEALLAPSVTQALIEKQIRALHEEIRQNSPTNPTLHGYKVYAQVDEDGIIEHIFERVGGGRTFVELGCGNGTENNTHYLLLKGWRGVWVDGGVENIKHILANVPKDSPRLLVEQLFITRENIAVAMQRWLHRLGGELDLLSLDIDGNDSIVLGEILTTIKPRVLVLEYNGKYPPPLKVSVAYDPRHGWTGDDYYGSSLQVFVDQLDGAYRLVSCSLSGANAFFVRSDLATSFANHSTRELYMPPRHHLIHRKAGGLPSLKHLKNTLTAL